MLTKYNVIVPYLSIRNNDTMPSMTIPCQTYKFYNTTISYFPKDLLPLYVGNI